MTKTVTGQPDEWTKVI